VADLQIISFSSADGGEGKRDDRDTWAYC